MKLLLDTHAFLWYCQDSSALSKSAKALIEDSSNQKALSVVSCWEIAIKAGIGKLILGEPSCTYLSNALTKTGIELLPMTLQHATAVEQLALHHRDPFDRLLVAQAMTEGLPIVTVDAHFSAYGVRCLW
ncbi:type II toxin-antitoxin system VapC family toxin [Planctomicrobium piriforme]|uniref:PIN domain nuclease, a component of toxin-antitoxin system (PIN domain) n=1 Tax=Planctomicrobium piriforme TaxID=1576369 RepID=A0A1I3J6J5_9PLAN|nr:type II toxin-antitoxin system VapC family toxin [Planctomicrobium piriforme]SFI55857.1 PIN domain nuclease, a component of toxin-antitoxin system (PIN domain) [Planctomicrobium piriforme]